jgi:4a-hydroxytetrahydrobiopterin dehydratase
MNRLLRKRCVACEAGVPRLAGRKLAALEEQLAELGGGWAVVRGRKLRRTFAFADFAGALDFVNAIGALAESQWHHPDLELAWGRVVVELFTHAVGGLTENDFIFAAKVDRLARRRDRERRKPLRGGKAGAAHG